MRHQINGKFYEYTDDQQLYRFLYQLLMKGAGAATLNRQGNVIRMNIITSTVHIYSVITLGMDLASSNHQRLGFALNVNYSQGVTDFLRINVTFQAPAGSWIRDVVKTKETLLAANQGPVTVSKAVGYYENEVEVSPERQDVLKKLKEI